MMRVTSSCSSGFRLWNAQPIRFRFFSADASSTHFTCAFSLNPGGILILSGILQEKETLVTNAFAAFDLIGPAISREAEWVCLRYRKGE